MELSNISLIVSLNETCRHPGWVSLCSKIWWDRELCHQQTSGLYWCLDLMNLRVHWPQSFVFFHLLALLCSPTLFFLFQSLPVCLNVSMCPDVSLSLCSLFACLLFSPDGMGTVSPGKKHKPTKQFKRAKLKKNWHLAYTLFSLAVICSSYSEILRGIHNRLNANCFFFVLISFIVNELKCNHSNL